MLINDYIKKIKKLNACGEAIQDALKYETSQELWDNCERGDWMLWLISKLSGEAGDDRRKPLVLTACKCARLSLKYVKKGELRPLKAIETTERWARGEEGVTSNDVRTAADASSDYAAYASAPSAYAAYAAADAYAAASSTYAAYDAYDAAAAVVADAAAAAYAASSTYAAYAAVVADASVAADAATLKKCADIVRADYPNIEDLFIIRKEK